MDDLDFAFRVPFGRGIFHDVVADSDDQIRFLQDLVLIIFLRDSNGPHGIFVIQWDDALGHHGVDGRNL